MAAIAAEVYSSMGLNEGEYRRILELLGREPTMTELGMFAVMWSEHCGYKHSRPLLKLFSRYREALDGVGLENAGIVEVGDGLAVTMKVESHNHPSAVEPYEGAATGVGGIIRDILSMGARPIALLDSLRFGPISADGGPTAGPAEKGVTDRDHYLFEQVVAGIAGYGNCVGVPTVAGEVGFHPRYSGNPLVNCMCVGVLRADAVATAAASGVGNPVLYLGSSTGKDGIHGATFASDTLGEDSEERRPNVQIGDPFAEKTLIEATLEALRTGAVIAIQDMGAAGLTCSTVEMSARGGVGMEVNLDLVPVREQGMSAYELMLSESQERMLAVVEKGREAEVASIFAKWGLHAATIGRVTDDGLLTVTRSGEVVCRLDPKLLADRCPTYSPPAAIPEYHLRAQSFDPNQFQHPPADVALLALLSAPSLASKLWVFRQYDFQVQTQTALIPGRGDAAVLALRGTRKGIAVKIDGNARAVYFDPRVGGKLAVAEAARNVACVGAMPTAVTDGLNFGNPERPHVFWQFSEAVRGIAEACEALRTPVISGNVSFYNETEQGEVLPTPLIGMLGVLEDAAKHVGMSPKSGRGRLHLLSVPLTEVRQQGLGASAYLAEVLGLEDGLPAEPSLEGERRLCEFLVEASFHGYLDFAHDLSEGGLAFAAAEVAIVGTCGMRLDLATSAGDPAEPFQFAASVAAALFGEIPGRVLIGLSEDGPDLRPVLKEAALRFGLESADIGAYEKGSDEFSIWIGGSQKLSSNVSKLKRAFENAIPSVMER